MKCNIVVIPIGGSSCFRLHFSCFYWNKMFFFLSQLGFCAFVVLFFVSIRSNSCVIIVVTLEHMCCSEIPSLAELFSQNCLLMQCSTNNLAIVFYLFFEFLFSLLDTVRCHVEVIACCTISIVTTSMCSLWKLHFQILLPHLCRAIKIGNVTRLL